MEIVYRSDLCGDAVEDLLKEISKRLKITGANLSYLIRLIEELIKNRKKIDKVIKKNLKDWKLNRLHLLERAILRVATCELLYFPDIPPKVVIDEAIEIAKEYTDDAGRRFINGVLNGIYQNTIGKNEDRNHL